MVRVDDGVQIVGDGVTSLASERTRDMHANIAGLCTNPFSIHTAPANRVLLQMSNCQLPTIASPNLRHSVGNGGHHNDDSESHAQDSANFPELDHER